MRALSKAANVYREDGYGALITRGLKRLLREIFETNSAFWFVRDLSTPLPQISPKRRVDIDLLSREQTIAWLKNNSERWVFNEREVEVALKENHYFPNVKCDGRIIGYAKVGRNKVYIHDYKTMLTFPEDSAFIYDTYIIPEYRGLKIASSLVAEIMSFLKNNGVRKLGCHIPPWNIASIKVYSSLGFEAVKHVRYLRFLTLKVFSARPGLAQI